MINYNTFNTLYTEATEYDDVELYISERGWQEWMNDLSDPVIADIMFFVWDCAKKDINFILDCEKSDAYFARKFSVPYRTVQNWRNGVNKAPEYLIKLIAFAELTDRFAEKEELPGD